MKVIELDHATLASRRSQNPCRHQSFAIEQGEFIGLLGLLNGAGKTTLMRAILGLLPPTAEMSASLAMPHSAGNLAIGYVPQTRTLLSDSSVRGLDFIGSSVRGERWGVPSLRRADRDLINETLAAVGARELAERPLSAMSGGERQRIILAQAIDVLGDGCCCSTEPLIGLDYRYCLCARWHGCKDRRRRPACAVRGAG